MEAIKQVVFICRTCEHYNSMERGDSKFEERQTEFESLTDAFKHLFYTHIDKNNLIHDMYARVEETSVDNQLSDEQRADLNDLLDPNR